MCAICANALTCLVVAEDRSIWHAVIHNMSSVFSSIISDVLWLKERIHTLLIHLNQSKAHCKTETERYDWLNLQSYKYEYNPNLSWQDFPNERLNETILLCVQLDLVGSTTTTTIMLLKCIHPYRWTNQQRRNYIFQDELEGRCPCMAHLSYF